MKKVTSVTVWNDSNGRRLSVTYSEIDEKTYRVVQDNARENFIVVGDNEIEKTDDVLSLAQSIIDSQE